MKKMILSGALVLFFSNPGFAGDIDWSAKSPDTSTAEVEDTHTPIVVEPEPTDGVKKGEIRRKPLSPSVGDDPTYHETMPAHGPRDE